MEREQRVELLGSVRGVREADFRMEQALLDTPSEERGSYSPGNKREGGSDEWFTLAELGDWLKVGRTTTYRLVRKRRIAAYRIGRAPASGVATWNGGWRTKAEALEPRHALARCRHVGPNESDVPVISAGGDPILGRRQ